MEPRKLAVCSRRVNASKALRKPAFLPLCPSEASHLHGKLHIADGITATTDRIGGSSSILDTAVPSVSAWGSTAFVGIRSHYYYDCLIHLNSTRTRVKPLEMS